MVGSTKMTFSSHLLRGVYEGEGGLSTRARTPLWQVSWFRGGGGEGKGVSPRWRAWRRRRLPALTSWSNQPRLSYSSEVTNPHKSPSTYLKSIFRITLSIIQPINEPLGVQSQHFFITGGIRAAQLSRIRSKEWLHHQEF